MGDSESSAKVHKDADRRLRGSHAADALPMGVKLPKGMDASDLMPYIQPAAIQIALAMLQVIGALILSSGPRICNMVNGAITSFGKKVNDRINLRIKTAVDKLFGEAFKIVKEKSDEFFPKFKDATSNLKKAMETAGKAGAAVAAVSSAAGSVGGIL